MILMKTFMSIFRQPLKKKKQIWSNWMSLGEFQEEIVICFLSGFLTSSDK